MPQVSKKTPQRMERLRSMHAVGASDREIGEAIGVTHHSVREWRKQLGLEAHMAAGPRATRRRIALPPETAVAAAQAAEVLAAEAMPGAAGLRPHELVARRLEAVRKLVEQLEPAVAKEDYPATSWARLCELEARLAGEVASLSPAVPSDPETDPANQHEADKVREKLERLVSVAEAGWRCHVCGCSPYPPAAAGVRP